MSVTESDRVRLSQTKSDKVGVIYIDQAGTKHEKESDMVRHGRTKSD